MKISPSKKVIETLLKVAEARGITGEHRPFDAQSIAYYDKEEYLKVVRTIRLLAEEELERLK